MWKLFVLVFFSVTMAVMADPIRFEEVNATMQVIADAVVHADDMIDYARPEFDTAFSNLKSEKLRYSLKGSIKNSPWLTGARSEVLAVATMVADRNVGRSGIQSSSEVQLKTDGLALVRYAAGLGLKKFHHTGQKYESRSVDLLRQFSQVSSLKELKTLFDSSLELTQEAVADEMKTREQNLACLNGSDKCEGFSRPEDPTALANQVLSEQSAFSKLQELDKNLKNVKIEALPSLDQVQVVRFSQGPWFGESNLTFRRSDGRWSEMSLDSAVEFSTDSLRVNISGFYPLEQKEMNKLKAELTEDLARVQTADGEYKEKMFKTFEDALASFKNAMRGEFK